jgi:hypothetical protein
MIQLGRWKQRAEEIIYLQREIVKADRENYRVDFQFCSLRLIIFEYRMKKQEIDGTYSTHERNEKSEAA